MTGDSFDANHDDILLELEKLFRETDTIDIIKNISNTKVIMGTSAGSIVLGKKITSKKFWEERYPQDKELAKTHEELNLVDFNIIPHYMREDHKKWTKDFFERVLKDNEFKVYAIKDSQAVVYNDGKIEFIGGTPDIYQICAMGKAVELLNYDNEKEIKSKRDYLLDKLLELDRVYLNGDIEKRLSNNINIRIENIILDNQQLVSVMDLLGYCISYGTACSSGDKKPSITLLSLGLTPNQANQSIRLTISNDNTYEQLDKFYNDFKNIIEQYKQ